MKPSKTTTKATLCCALLAVVSNLATPDLFADNNANGHAFWTIDGNPADITAIDQEIWIPVPAKGMQWVLYWAFETASNAGGYLGFNADADGKAQMIFSIWGATASLGYEGAPCLSFDEDGPVRSCRRPVSLNEKAFYRLHLERTKVEADGVWWSASISEVTPDDGKRIDHPIGAHQTPPDVTFVRGASLDSFIEYFGNETACSAVPVSGFYASEPQANPKSLDLGYHYTAKIQSLVGGDDCKLGTEKTGASFRGQSGLVQYDGWKEIYPDTLPSARGIFLFLGGPKEKLDIGTIMKGVPALKRTAVVWKVQDQE